MSSAIHRGTSLQSLSLDEIGVTQVQSASIDSTVDSKVSDSAQDRRKSFRGVKSADTTDNQETVSDVRAWAKEASFKLKSFNYKIPGDKGSLAKGKSADSTNPPITNTTTAGIAMSSNNVKSSITTTVTTTVEVKVEKPATPPPAPEPEPTSNITSSTTSATNSSVDSLETPPQEPATTDDIGEREKLTVVPEANEAEENADDSTVATIVDQANTKKKRIGPNGEEIDDEEDDANDELNNVKLKPTVQNTFVKEEAAPIFTNVNLKPVPKVIDSKTFNTDKPTTGVYSFLQLKATRFGSRDSLSTLSASHDDDHLSIRSEPLPPRKPREHVLTPYEHLKKINKTKVYGDYAPEELERYLSDEEFQKVLGKNRSEFYTLPLWKQHFLKKRAQIF